MRTRTNRHDHGFSIVELLVVIGILGVLAGLTIPAVQAAREASRRAQCKSNLRQLVLATQAFESAEGGLPTSQFWGRPFNASHPDKIFSLHCLLLPYLEQGNLYNDMNFSLPSGTIETLLLFHRTAATHRLSVFMCPAEVHYQIDPLAPVSYRACTGNGEMKKRNGLIYTLDDGLFVALDSIREPTEVLPLSAVHDGLSNTLAFSEKPVGSGRQSRYHPFRDYSLHPKGGNMLSADDWISACAELSNGATQRDAGSSWMLPGAISTHFFASAPPNSRIGDCGVQTDFGTGLFAARSYHPGGVNAALGDGSVRWFSSGTDVRLWRGLATRSGGELISLD